MPLRTGSGRALAGMRVNVQVYVKRLLELTGNLEWDSSFDYKAERSPSLTAARGDHVAAAKLRNVCRRNGLRIGTIDALIARLCIRHALTLMTTDRDFDAVASLTKLKLWRAP